LIVSSAETAREGFGQLRPLGLLLSGPEIVCVQKNTGYSGYTGYNPHEYWRFLLPVVTAVTFRPTLCPTFPFLTLRQEREGWDSIP
jgi:hypothetical protein